MTSTELLQDDGLMEKALIAERAMDKLLTKREMQILQQIVEGKTNKEIARILCRSHRTIEYHRNRLMGKLGAHSVVDLVKRAIKVGIL